MRQFATALLCALALLGMFALWTCGGGRVETLKFSLPPGYTGLIIVLADPITGRELTFEGGIALLQVPADGIVRLKSLDGFEYGYNEQFFAADGLQLEYNNPTRQKGVVEVHSLGRSATIEGDVSSPDRIVFFVGTFEEVSRYQEQMDRSGKGLPTGPTRSE